MDIGVNFPLDPFYKGCILDAETISNRNGWWTAVLLIKEPRSNEKFVALYKWQQVQGSWKKRSSWKFKSNQDFLTTFSIVQKYVQSLDK
jgi:hypothetical protein